MQDAGGMPVHRGGGHSTSAKHAGVERAPPSWQSTRVCLFFLKKGGDDAKARREPCPPCSPAQRWYRACSHCGVSSPYAGCTPGVLFQPGCGSVGTFCLVAAAGRSVALHRSAVGCGYEHRPLLWDVALSPLVWRAAAPLRSGSLCRGGVRRGERLPRPRGDPHSR